MSDQIKMFIAGEEVVSQNEFTINEEMLSASSTILNNCYPKSWELTKDYISNFYYPKDYSRFVIGQGECLHGNDEFAVLTESGSNPSYETNVEKEWNSFNVYGSTYQETSTQSANLFDESYYNDDSIYTQGTYKYVKARILGNRTLYFKASLKEGKTIQTGAYICISESAGLPYISGTKSAYAIRSGSITNNSTDFTGVNELYINVYPNNLNVATIFDNYNLWVSTDNINYVPFVPDMPSPDYPSELVSVGYENLFDGVFETGIYNGNTGAKVNIGGFIRCANYIPVKELTNYMFSSDTTAFNGFLVYEYKEDKTYNLTTNKAAYFNQKYTTNKGTKYITFRPNAAFTDTSIKVQITEGTQVHSYIPYGKYGIEIKNTGKNLANGLRYGYYRESDGVYVNNNFYSCSDEPIIVNGITNFVFSINGVSSNGYAYTYDSQGNYLGRKGIINNGIFTPLPDVKYFNYAFKDSTIANVPLDSKIQIEQGTQPTIFEKYKSNSQLYVLDEPLRAIKQYQDKLYVNNGVLFVERKIGETIINGSESGYTDYPNNVSELYKVYTTDVKLGRTNDLEVNSYSNYFENTYNYAPSSTKIGIGLTRNATYFCVPSTIANNTTDFKNWLSTHNTEVQYVLATPTITPIGYVDLPNSYENINYVELGTGLETSMEVYYYWKNYDVLFAGVVKNSGDISLNPRHPHYCSLQILDYKTFLSESNTLDFVIANKTISEAISMVVNAVSGYGFIVGNIDIDSANDIIGAYSTLNKSAYDVLQYLAEISGSRWRARVVDSLTMAIDFYDPDTLPQAEDIEYTQEYWENNNIVDLTFNYGTRDYRNKQILLSDEVYANINYDETLISNGYSNTFTLQNNIGDVVSVVVDGAEKTIGTNNDKQMGVEADFYFTPGKNVIESNSVYSAGTMIHLTYQPLVKGRQIVYNNSEIDRISQQTQTEGVIARYETRNDVLSSDELEKIAKTYIEYKGKAEVILTLRTQNKDLYNIGEVVYFNAPISDLAQNYMVKSKKIEYVVINKIVNLFYIYELTSSFNNEKAINYFDNQRSKATGNIEEGESITRNVDIETQANIIWSDGSVSSATVTVTGDNVLNCALNSPFVE